MYYVLYPRRVSYTYTYTGDYLIHRDAVAVVETFDLSISLDISIYIHTEIHSYIQREEFK